MKPYVIRALPIVKNVSTEKEALCTNMLYQLSVHSIKYFALVTGLTVRIVNV
jgi:hypothetical protein